MVVKFMLRNMNIVNYHCKIRIVMQENGFIVVKLEETNKKIFIFWLELNFSSFVFTVDRSDW